MFGGLMLMSILFFFSNHPLVMGLILIVSTFFVSIHVFFILSVAWFSYILFLVFLGGMLILFIYVASLASNEMMGFNLKYGLFFICFFTFVGSWVYAGNDLFIWKLYFYYPFSIIVVFLGVYLLLTLIGVVKISKLEEGPLREMIYESS